MDLQHLFTELQINETEALIDLADNDWKTKVSFPSRVIRLLENAKKWEPKAIFCFDNKPLILFFENPKDKKELHKAVWNFNETPIVFVIENNKVTIYNGFVLDGNTELLKKLGGKEKLTDFRYFELVTGKTFEKYNKDFAYQNRVDYKLLENIEETQKEFQRIGFTNRKIANALLGKVIFIRYLIDRKVKLNFNNESKVWENNDFCDLLNHREQVFNFFESLRDEKKGFNGNLFHINPNDFDTIPNEAFSLIQRLLKGEEIKLGQKSLFQLYDFSVLPIEFISNVYERFIGKENQAKAGAYYTPTFLVDYIISQTVAKKLNNNEEITSCKVLDPACGSGIFLVEALRKIIEKHIAVNGISENTEDFKETLKQLARENIFGIDKDESAVQVAIFSVYLTLLDYQEPPEIATFTFPPLLGTNFFVADSFNTEADYNNAFEDIKFDYILGNPPWAGAKKGLDRIGKRYINQRKKKEKTQNKEFEIGINNNEIAEGFVFRASDFCSPDTQIAFIIRSSILYNIGYSEQSPFRPYWLQEFHINQVFELAPVRKEVFNHSSAPAIAPAVIVFYKYAHGHSTDKNIIEHITLKPSRFFSIFKIFTINRNDYNKVEQSKLKKDDWLWKSLVYGSYLDFNFINSIKTNYPQTIKSIISDKIKYVTSTGLHSRSIPLKNPKNTSLIQHIPFLKTNAIESFHIDSSSIGNIDFNKIDIVKDVRIYQAPMLLVREGIEMDSLMAKSTISKNDFLFKDSITSIKVLNESDLYVLHNIAAIFNSYLFSYFAVNTFSSIGIERERVKNYNKFSLPYLDLNVQKDINDIENLNSELYRKKKDGVLNSTEQEIIKLQIDKKLSNLNKKVLNKLELSDCENALIDYALNVNKTIIVGKNNEKEKLFKAIKPNDKLLTDYAQLYINRFAKNLSKNGKKFTVEIWHTNQVIGMFFKVVDESEFVNEIDIKDKQKDSAIIQFLIKAGKQKITEQLFVQKDIRGFDKDQFYIFKPNEKRLWHKAIGYLDVDEFADAILKAGRNAK